MAAGTEILTEQTIIAVSIGLLRRIELAAVGRLCDERRHTTRIELIQFAANRLARLTERQRMSTRIATAARTCTTTALETSSQSNNADETRKTPHVHSHLFESFVLTPLNVRACNLRF